MDTTYTPFTYLLISSILIQAAWGGGRQALPLCPVSPFCPHESHCPAMPLGDPSWLEKGHERRYLFLLQHPLLPSSLEERDDRENPGRVVSISLISCGGPRISLEPGRNSHHGANRLQSSRSQRGFLILRGALFRGTEAASG